MSGNKQDLIDRLQSSLLDEGDDLLDQVLGVVCNQHSVFPLRPVLGSI